VPTLQHRDVDRSAERGGGTRHVLCQQLLLERLGRRRDHDAKSRVERRHEVGEAFPRPGSGLRQQMPATGDRERDRLRELGLLVAHLEAVEDARERSGLPEDVSHRSELSDPIGDARRKFARSDFFRIVTT
jgi:hypothetical protein